MAAGPYNWLGAGARRPALLCLTVLLVCSSAWLTYMDQPLRTIAAPNGIVSFELAGSLARSAEILDSWSEQAHSAALLIQGFDYLYLFIYPAWFALAAVMFGAKLGGNWQGAGIATGWIVLLAVPTDAVENYALIQQLLHGPSEALAQLALWSAISKFAVILLATVFLLAALATWAGRILKR